MSFKADKLRAVLEDVDDLGLLVLTDGRWGFRVRNWDSSPLGFYCVDDETFFSWGWVELPDSMGRVDCLDWPTYYDEIRSRAKRPPQVRAVDEREAQRRRSAGLPTLRCPSCGQPAAHWVPSGLGEAGYFTCSRSEVP